MFRRQTEVTTYVKHALIASYLPLVFLCGLWALLRLAYGESYIIWEMEWIPFVTVILTVGWHYSLLYYFLSPLTQQEGRANLAAKNFHLQYAGWMIATAALIIVFLIGMSFFISRSNPASSLSYVF